MCFFTLLACPGFVKTFMKNLSYFGLQMVIFALICLFLTSDAAVVLSIKILTRAQNGTQRFFGLDYGLLILTHVNRSLLPDGFGATNYSFFTICQKKPVIESGLVFNTLPLSGQLLQSLSFVISIVIWQTPKVNLRRRVAS